jgi:predicted lipoprotein with Yx(FWY)xxD motif
MKKLWTVVGVIIVLAVLGYGGYRVYHHYTYKPAPPPPAATNTQAMKAKPTEAMKASPSEAMMQETSLIKMTPAGKLGTIITDPKGMTLYTYSTDTKGVSNCSGACLKAWPAYVAQSQTGKFPANISVIKRSDGTLQYAWKGMPLYYYVKDTKPGDVTGQGVGGVWYVAK